MPDSRRQLRLAFAVRAGKSKKMPRKVAEEMIDAVHGKSLQHLPERAPKRKA